MRNRTLTGMAGRMIAVVAIGVGATLLARWRRTGRQSQDSRATRETDTPLPVQPERTYSPDDIARRAYFIAQRRQAAGCPPAPHQDWLDAESELQTENMKHPIEPESP